MKNSLNLNEEKLNAFANAVVHYNIEKELRSRYDKILADNTYHTKETQFQLSTLVKVAAVALAVFGCIFLLQMPPNTPSIHTTAQNFLDQTQILGNPDITRKGASIASPIRREANDAFTQKNFPLAIKKYEELKTQSDFSSLDQFYLGISYLKTDNHSIAIELLSEINSGEKTKTVETSWLLSLAYILSNQQMKAVPMLEQIKRDKRYKAKEAEELLNAIN